MKLSNLQNRPNRLTLIILAAYFAAMVVVGLIVQLCLGSVAVYFGWSSSVFTLFTPALALISLIWLTIITGSILCWADVRKGGGVVARRFGAVQASNRSRHTDENTLLQVLAEMAVVSRCPRPEVYVLRNESTINSFAVGSLNGDNAIVLTQGALEALTRDELQSLVAHELSHIVNEDVPLNMVLMIALGGLLALDEVGQVLLMKGRERGRINLLIAGGLTLRILGGVGVQAAALLRLLFSREQEALADAKAIEYQQDAKPLASALYRINHSLTNKVALSSHYVDEIKHLCLHAGNRQSWWQKIWASHPSFEERIQAIDPNFQYQKRPDAPRTSRKSATKKASETNTASGGTEENVSDNGTLMNIDYAPTKRTRNIPSAFAKSHSLDLQSSASNEDSAGDRVTLTLHNAETSLAAVFALFLPSNDKQQANYLSAVAFCYNQKFSNSVKYLGSSLRKELAVDRLRVAQFAAQQLRHELNSASARRVLLNLERLLKAQKMHSLMNYAAVQYFRRELGADFPILTQTDGKHVANAEQNSVKTFNKMGEEIGLLLSLVLEMTNKPPATLDAEYLRALKCYTKTRYPRRTAKETSMAKEVEAAYQLLLVQPQTIRKVFVKHCVEITKRDKTLTPEKRSQMQLFAASLGAPLGLAITKDHQQNASKCAKSA